LSDRFGIELEQSFVISSSVSAEETVPVSPRKRKKTASAAQSKLPAKNRPGQKGSKKIKEMLTRKQALTSKGAGKPEKEKKKVTSLAKKSRLR
jgi:hypothetical protein